MANFAIAFGTGVLSNNMTFSFSSNIYLLALFGIFFYYILLFFKKQLPGASSVGKCLLFVPIPPPVNLSGNVFSIPQNPIGPKTAQPRFFHFQREPGFLPL